MIELTAATLPERPPARTRDCNKGDFGAVAVLGGAPGMSGAVLLAGRAALFCGAGRVYAGMLDDRVACDPVAPELMIRPAEALAGALADLPRPCALVVGPGLGISAAARRCLEAALASDHTLVLDADALNLLAADADLTARLRERPGAALITPHPGEAGRLLGHASADIQADRAGAARALAGLTGAVVVLKGAGTLVLGGDGELRRNTTGNPGMAAAGMGDVLAGIIGALLAQGMTADAAAALGVWLHGAAADAAVTAGLGPLGLTASDVIVAVRRLLNAPDAER